MSEMRDGFPDCHRMLVAIAQHDSRDRVRNIGREIFMWRVPGLLSAHDHIHDFQDRLRVAAREGVRAAFDGFRSFGNIADGDVGNAHDAGLFLDGTAIG